MPVTAGGVISRKLNTLLSGELTEALIEKAQLVGLLEIAMHPAQPLLMRHGREYFQHQADLLHLGR